MGDAPDGPAPRRPRRWSAPCTGTVVRVAVALVLVALVAWPERHLYVVHVATATREGVLEKPDPFDPGGLLFRWQSPISPEALASDPENRVYGVWTTHEQRVRAWEARRRACDGLGGLLLSQDGLSDEPPTEGHYGAWWYRDASLGVVLGALTR